MTTSKTMQTIADELNTSWNSYPDGYARHQDGYNFYGHAMALGREHGVGVDDDRHERSGNDVTDEIYFTGGWSLVLSRGGWSPVETGPEFEDLEDLIDAIEDGRIRADQDLPVFGGEEPSDTEMIYSWDEERLLVNEGEGFYTIDRSEWSCR